MVVDRFFLGSGHLIGSVCGMDREWMEVCEEDIYSYRFPPLLDSMQFFKFPKTSPKLGDPKHINPKP